MVDDEPELVNATTAMLAREVGEGHVRGTSDPRDVVQWLADERPAVLITDVRMPHVTGLELVTRLHERWGPVPVVIITAYPTAQVDEAARAGRFAFLAKPFSFQALRDTLLRVCVPAGASAFSGAIAVSMLGEVVQLYGLANRTGLLRVSTSEGVGEIGFHSGRVIDATAPGVRGVEAFNTILAWTSGSFGWEPTPPREHTIHGGLSELLIDAYRLRDEQEHHHDDEPATDPDAQMESAFDALLHNDEDIAVAVTGNVEEQLQKLERLEGFRAVAFYDMDRGVTLASIDRNLGVDVTHAVMGHAEVVEAKQKTVLDLQLDDEVEDIVITLRDEYHLLRLCRQHRRHLFFLMLDRHEANLAMARYVLAGVEHDIVL